LLAGSSTVERDPVKVGDESSNLSLSAKRFQGAVES
jgi:hypothetical protein